MEGAAGCHTPLRMNTVKRAEQLEVREAEVQGSLDWDRRVAQDMALLERRKAEVERSLERRGGEEVDQRLRLSMRKKTPPLTPISPGNSSGSRWPSTSGPATQGSGLGVGGKENQNYGARPRRGSQVTQAASASPR